MLKLEIKTPWHEQLLHVVIAIFFVLATVFMFNLLVMMWDRDICGSIKISEYTSKSAPAKCQALYEKGKLW